MLSSTALVLFESTDSPAILADPANLEWVALVRAVSGPSFDLLARRYYLALFHLRQHPRRPDLPGRSEVRAASRKGALQGVLNLITARKDNQKTDDAAGGTFVEGASTH